MPKNTRKIPSRAAAPKNAREAAELEKAEAIGREGEPRQAGWFLADVEGLRRRARATMRAGAVGRLITGA